MRKYLECQSQNLLQAFNQRSISKQNKNIYLNRIEPEVKNANLFQGCGLQKYIIPALLYMFYIQYNIILSIPEKN